MIYYFADEWAGVSSVSEKAEPSGVKNERSVSDFQTKEEFLDFLKYVDFDTLDQQVQSELTLYLEEEAIKMARDSFYHFVRLMGPVRIDGFQPGRHIEKICEELQDLSVRMWGKTGLTVRKMVSLPPGGMKSELCTRLFPAWLLGRYPRVRMIIIGHGIDFARDEFGAKIRDIVRMDEYKKIFPKTELREDKQTAGRFLTTDGGEMVCSSLEAKIAGRRGHIVITDDAIVEDDAYSKPVRTRLVSGYMSNVRSRLLMTPDCAELNVGTRWVQGDLFDYLETEDRKSGAPWELIRIPALLDEAASKYLRRDTDPEGHLVVGTSFWPEFHPTRRLEMIRASYANNMSKWNAVYQQNPTPEEGELLSPTDFQHWLDTDVPECHTTLITADTAYTKNTQSDFTAWQVWGIFKRQMKSGGMKNNAILISEGKGKWDYPELCEIFTNLYGKYDPDYFVLEERSSGLALIPDLRSRGLPVYGWKTEKDKHVRVQAAAPIVKSGIIWVPMPKDRPDIIEKSTEFIGEICMFPGGAHDDRIDAMSQFLLFARDNKLLMADGYEDEYEEEEDEWGDYDDSGFNYTSSLLR